MTAFPPTPRRVLHVLGAYDPNEAQGSSIRTIAELSAGEHHLATGSARDVGDEFASVTETGVRAAQVGRRDRERLADLVARIRPDVVHFHGGPLGATSLAGGWAGGVPVVASIYAWPTVNRETFRSDIPLRHLRNTPVLAPRTVAGTVVPRNAVVAAMRRGGVRAVVSSDPAVRDRFAAHALPVGLVAGMTRPVLGAAVDPVPGSFLFAGRAELTRGPDLLARAVARLRAAGVPVSAQFCFLQTADVDMVAATAAVDGCTVHVGGIDLDAAMARAHAVVLPFRHDDATLAPALVANEALALGVPVVGGDVRCISAAVTHGRNGLLVPPGDVGALAGALDLLTRRPDVARRLGAAGARDIARRWDVASLVDVAGWAYRVAMDLRSLPVSPGDTGPTCVADLSADPSAAVLPHLDLPTSYQEA